MKWWVISLILCLYGFFKEYRPSEPFISPFLTGPWKNFTSEQVNQEIYPVGTYCNLSLLVAVFLLTDFLRYKPVVVIGGMSGVVTWSLLIWGTTITHMQIVEFFYGLFMASEVAYFTYMYAKVSKQHYQKVTSHTRTAFLLGKASAGLSSQLFVLYNALDYLQLNYLTVAGVGSATLVAIFLPSVPSSVYFHRTSVTSESSDSSKETTEVVEKAKYAKGNKFQRAVYFLFYDFKSAFTNYYVLKWSIWWALATCGYYQVTSYSQLLWEDMIKDQDVTLYHGFVEFGYSLLGAAMTFGVGFFKIRWELWGEVALAALTLVQGGVLLYSAFINNLYLAYVLYMIYGILYQAAITIASSEVAKKIKEDSYALVFGVNTFFALVSQTVLTVIVIDALKSTIRTQFEIYGVYHIIIGFGFVVASVFTCIYHRKKVSAV